MKEFVNLLTARVKQVVAAEGGEGLYAIGDDPSSLGRINLTDLAPDAEGRLLRVMTIPAGPREQRPRDAVEVEVVEVEVGAGTWLRIYEVREEQEEEAEEAD